MPIPDWRPRAAGAGPRQLAARLGAGVRAIAVKCDLCHFDDRGPACVRTCPTKALMLVDSRDIALASKRKRQLTFNTDLGDLSLFQAQQGERE